MSPPSPIQYCCSSLRYGHWHHLPSVTIGFDVPPHVFIAIFAPGFVAPATTASLHPCRLRDNSACTPALHTHSTNVASSPASHTTPPCVSPPNLYSTTTIAPMSPRPATLFLRTHPACVPFHRHCRYHHNGPDACSHLHRVRHITRSVHNAHLPHLGFAVPILEFFVRGISLPILPPPEIGHTQNVSQHRFLYSYNNFKSPQLSLSGPTRLYLRFLHLPSLLTYFQSTGSTVPVDNQGAHRNAHQGQSRQCRQLFA